MMFQQASLLYPPPGMAFWPSYQPPALNVLKLRDAPMLGNQLTPSAVRVRLVPAPRTAWCTSGPSCDNPTAEITAQRAMARLNGVLAVRGIPARTSLFTRESCPVQYAINVDLLPGSTAQGLPTQLDGVTITYFTSP